MADNFVGWGPSNHDGGLVRVFQSDHAIHMLSFRVFQLPRYVDDPALRCTIVGTGAQLIGPGTHHSENVGRR